MLPSKPLLLQPLTGVYTLHIGDWVLNEDLGRTGVKYLNTDEAVSY